MDNIDIQIGERLKQARLLLGFSTAVAFSARLGLENQTYGRYEKGERGLPDEIKIQLFKMGINISWLVTGQGEPLMNNQSEKIPLIEELREIIEKTMEPKLENIETRLLALEIPQKQEKPAPKAASGGGPLHIADPAPAYGGEEEEYRDAAFVWGIAAGPPVEIDEDRSVTVKVPARFLKPGERYYAGGIKGTSMTGAGIMDGDLALFRYTDVPKDGAIQAVRYRDKVTLKRLREVEGKGWELRFMDGSGGVIECDSDGYETLGEFVAVLPEKCRPAWLAAERKKRP